MEMNVIEERPKKLVAEFEGADHTLCSALKTELYSDDQVKTAAYSINHPLVGVPRFIVETKGKDPKKALAEAAKRLAAKAAKIKKDFRQL